MSGGTLSMKKIIFAILLTLTMLGFSAFGQEQTVVNNAKSETILRGKHKLSLQWISWNYFGAANVTNNDGVYYLKGEQTQRDGTDFVKVDGVITEIGAKEFKFNGTITMQVSHINNGEPCERTGDMTFKITGKRKYWRLQEMDNPCEGVTDYVDIYFR
jgi:hypothetical protein